MPELPEVETTRRGLMPHVVGRQVEQVIIRQHQLRWPISPALSEALPGQTISAIQRRAKYLLLDAGSGYVCIHLGMSGRLRIVPAKTPPTAHDHIDIVLNDGQAIRFNDTRRFGSIFWLTGDVFSFPLLASLGPEPLDDSFDGAWLYENSRQRRVAVKNFIMDSHTVVGVGNIYASESLFAAGIHPKRAAGRISAQRYAELAAAIKQTLHKAIAAGGTTLRDYIGVDGTSGYFQLALAVYDKAGQPCPRDGESIRRVIIGQRSTFYCPRCQT